MAGAWQPHVPVATIGRPLLPDTVVRRDAVVDTLLAAGGGDLVVIAAPAGYGKTTVVVQWETAAAGLPFAWVRIDDLDNDPVHLLLHIATAIAAVRDIDATALAYFAGPGRRPDTQLVPALAQLLEACGPIVVVLDDVHELTSDTTLAAVVDTAPPTATLVLVGRVAPQIELARRRLSGHVVDIGRDQLKLAAAEAATVFEAAGGKATGAVLDTVIDKTEGWTAGVLLAAMALRNGAEVARLTGRNRLVADYLVEEVITPLDAGTTAFLLESSVLERMCAAYLDDVLQRDDSARMLTAITRSRNLLLIPLDEERIWFRYHRLFGDLLRARLLEADPARFRVLAGRAAELLQREGDVDGALRQAVAAGDRARAAALVGADAVQLGFDGRAGVLARRLERLDEQTFAEYPDAAIARAWLGVTRADAGLIQQSLILAQRADHGGPLADGTPSVPVAAALIASMVGIGGVTEVIRNADIVCGAGGPLQNPWWEVATVMKGAALAMMGEPGTARLLLESALPVLGDVPGFHATALAHLALLDLDDRNLAAAIARSTQARGITDGSELCDMVPMIAVYAVSALVRARIGDADEANSAVEAAERLLDGLGDAATRTALLGHVLLAAAGLDLEAPKVVARHLDAARRLAPHEPDAAGLLGRLQTVEARGARVDLVERLTAAESRLLPHLATHLPLQGIADRLVLSRDTVKSQTAAIYRKFGVSSRSEAVEFAKSIGLLGD